MRELYNQLFKHMVGVPFRSNIFDTNVIVGYDKRIRDFSNGDVIGAIGKGNILILFNEWGGNRLKGKEEIKPI